MKFTYFPDSQVQRSSKLLCYTFSFSPLFLPLKKMRNLQGSHTLTTNAKRLDGGGGGITFNSSTTFQFQVFLINVSSNNKKCNSISTRASGNFKFLDHDRTTKRHSLWLYCQWLTCREEVKNYNLRLLKAVKWKDLPTPTCAKHLNFREKEMKVATF